MTPRTLSPILWTVASVCTAACSNADDTHATTQDATSTSTTDETAAESGSESNSSSGDGDGDPATETGEPESLCGNGMVDEGEQCDLGPLLSDNGGCTAECALAACGDGLLYIGEEACDDGNSDETDECTTLCMAPNCSDGFVSGDESDIDCGGGCMPCEVGLNCELPSDCETWACDAGTCDYATNCAAINAVVPEAPSGRYFIDADADGPNTPFEVFCELEQAGGGWTLVLVSSDDGQSTWTWVNRLWMATDPTVVGGLDEMHRDFKSRAYNEVVFRDILAMHQPSAVWAQYDDVSTGNTDLGHFVGVAPSPTCDYALAGNGFEMTDGTLMAGAGSMGGVLCDTDLYMNLGDHDGTIDDCLGSFNWATATFGLGWNVGGNNGCNFDDPDVASLGPSSQCGFCAPGTDQLEIGGYGFGAVFGLNTGTVGTGENHIEVFVR